MNVSLILIYKGVYFSEMVFDGIGGKWKIWHQKATVFFHSFDKVKLFFDKIYTPGLKFIFAGLNLNL